MRDRIGHRRRDGLLGRGLYSLRRMVRGFLRAGFGWRWRVCRPRHAGCSSRFRRPAQGVAGIDKYMHSVASFPSRASLYHKAFLGLLGGRCPRLRIRGSRRYRCLSTAGFRRCPCRSPARSSGGKLLLEPSPHVTKVNPTR